MHGRKHPPEAAAALERRDARPSGTGNPFGSRMDLRVHIVGEGKIRGGNVQEITPFLWFDDHAEEAANF